MTKAWKTKYGPRRVRRDPPTLDEAIFAAQGLTDDPQAQVEIAASLLGVPARRGPPPLALDGRFWAAATRIRGFYSLHPLKCHKIAAILTKQPARKCYT